MKRPTQGGLAGIAVVFTLLSIPHFVPIPEAKRTLVLYCNRHRTNIESIRPNVSKQIAESKTAISTLICMLEGRYPIQENGPLPVPVNFSNCLNPEKPLKVGLWEPVQVNDEVEVAGWSSIPPYKPVNHQLGYFYKEYRVVQK